MKLRGLERLGSALNPKAYVHMCVLFTDILTVCAELQLMNFQFIGNLRLQKCLVQPDRELLENTFFSISLL